jgi:hypothetical protein
VSRRHPGLFDHRDANWIDCECRVQAGTFRGELRADLRSNELSAFLDELRALGHSSEGLAALTPEEGRLALTVQGDALGRLRVSGEAIDLGNRLQFQFDLDPSALRSICEGLERVLDVFPVVAEPEV